MLKLSTDPAIAALGATPRSVVTKLIKLLAKSVPKSLGKDVKHCQHLWSLAKWCQGGCRNNLMMDCAGLSLAVVCLSHSLSFKLPALAALRAVSLQACFFLPTCVAAGFRCS